MELVAKETYREPTFELWPGDDTVGMELSEEHKAAMLADFPNKLEEIKDVDLYVKEKQARLAAEAMERQKEISEMYEDLPFFASDPMTSADAFEAEKDFVPESKEAGLDIETPESKQTKGKRK